MQPLILDLKFWHRSFLTTIMDDHYPLFEFVCVQGKNYCNYIVKISVRGNFPIRVYQNMLSRHVTTIKILLAQEVLAQLPEFSYDEANNLASCVVV